MFEQSSSGTSLLLNSKKAYVHHHGAAAVALLCNISCRLAVQWHQYATLHCEPTWYVVKKGNGSSSMGSICDSSHAMMDDTVTL